VYFQFRNHEKHATAVFHRYLSWVPSFSCHLPWFPDFVEAICPHGLLSPRWWGKLVWDFLAPWPAMAFFITLESAPESFET
jgi:hypothetical protein